MANRRPRGGGVSRSNRRTRSTGGNRRPRGSERRPEAPKAARHAAKRGGFFADLGLEDIIGAPAVGIARALREIPSRHARRAADITEALGTSAGRVIRHPRATVRGGYKTITGLPEAVEAIVEMRTGKKGWRGLPYVAEGIPLIGTVRRPRKDAKSDAEIAKVLGSAAWQDYKRRYGPDWEKHANEDPLSNLLDVLSIAGGATRGAALVGAAGRVGKLSEAGRLATALTQPRKVWKESSRPGLAEGVTRTREIAYQPPTGENVIGVTKGYSRTPLMRGLQEIGMDVAEQFPRAPMVGMRSRATRGQAMRVQRAVQQLFGGMRGVSSLEGLDDAELVRMWAGEQMGDHSAETMRHVRDVLARETTPEILGDDAEFAEWLREAKKAGFGPQLVKQLDKAVALAEKTPVGQWGEKYERAIEGMQEMTRATEEQLLDANGFSDIQRQLLREDDRIANLTDPDEIAASQEKIDRLLDKQAELKKDLPRIFANRRGLFRNFIWDNMEVKTPLKDAHREHLLERGLTNPMIDDLFAVTDKMAIAQRPQNPSSWWEDKIGAPSSETAEAFMGRVEKGGLAAQYQLGEGIRPTVTGKPDSIYYSPLQQWADEKMPRRVPAEQLRETARKAIPPMEFENAGLDLFFGQYEPGEFVYREDFLEHLANKLNAYNLEEHYFSGASREAAGLTHWDTWEGGVLLSRDGLPAERREIVMRLPDLAGARQDVYIGKGAGHWGQSDVVFHIRFQVFEEGGVRKLLIEEIQSDWASDVRRAKRQGVHPDMSFEERKARVTELRKGLREGDRELLDLDNEISALERQAQDLDPDSDELAGVMNRMDELEARFRERQAAHTAEAEDVSGLDMAGFQRAPLRDRYHRAALRRMAREAVEEDVDEIIITDPTTQAVRNSYEHELLDWQEPDSVTPRMVREEAELSPDTFANLEAWEKTYGRDFPEFMRKEYGVTPERRTAAYEGRYSTQGRQRTATGQMPGTVIAVTDGFREQARKAQALYQRSPNWNTLPKGATELLGDGRTALRMFETGDASTWIHELAHVGIHDLDAAQRKVIEEAFGGGKPIEEWVDTQHENYARAFERYLRYGEAPTRSLQPVFARLSQWIGAVWRVEGARAAEVSPEVAKVFGEMLTPHHAADTPKTFIPHRAWLPNLAGARASKGIPRAQRVIGDQVRSGTPLLKRNKLALVRSGMVNPDPRLLIEHMNRVVMLARANQLREMVVEIAEPIRPGEGFDPETEYVVKAMGSRTDNEFYDALEASEDPDVVKGKISDFLDDNIGGRNLWDKWTTEDPDRQDLYVVDKKTVDLLFKNVTGKLPGATTKAGKSTFGALADATLDSVRALLLYANPGFYTANILGNTGMALLSDPRSIRDAAWAFNNARKAVVNEDKADPLFVRAAVEMGRGPTGGGLSQHDPVLGYRAGGREIARHPVESWKRRRPGGVGRTGEAISSGYAGWGRRSGRMIDDMFRVAAWKQAARKQGVKGDEAMLKLLEQGVEDARGKLGRSDTEALTKLDSIRSEAEQLMLDFDSMTPFEKTYLTRAIFLYPFLKASAKWPAFYGAERPITAGVGGQASLIGQQVADEEMGEAQLPEWMKGYSRIFGGVLPTGSFAPQSAALDLADMLVNINEKPAFGIKGPFDLSNPLVRQLILWAQGRNEFGRGVSRTRILWDELPLTGLQRQLITKVLPGVAEDKPSEVWRDREWYDTLLRSLRAVPSEVDKAKAREQVKKAKSERAG